MDQLGQAAQWLRDGLAQQEWLEPWGPTLAATPDWALLTAGPAFLAVFLALLWWTWPRATKQGLRKTPDTEPSLRRALAISEATFGPDHPSVATSLTNLSALFVATSLNNLGMLLRDTGRSAEAEPLFARALSIARAAYGLEAAATRTVDQRFLPTLENKIWRRSCGPVSSRFRRGSSCE
jgi:hypothetical protein